MDFLSDPNFCVLKPITYYVCPAGQTVANYDGDGLNTAVTPSDSNDGLTKATPLATIAAAAAKIAGKVLLAPVTIQLADTEATANNKVYFADEVEFNSLCLGGAPFSSSLEKALNGVDDVYPAAYIHIKGNLSTPNNITLTGAATYNGTTSATQCAFVARNTVLRVEGLKINYFRAADGDRGAITGYNSRLYVETINATSDHTGNDGSLVSGFFQSVVMLGGSFNITNSGFARANAQSILQTYSPKGYCSLTFSHSGASCAAIMTNEGSHAMVQGGTWSFSGSGAYYCFWAITNSSINFNNDASATWTFNASNAKINVALQRSVINEALSTASNPTTFTAFGQRAFARNGSIISYQGTTAGSTADEADGGSFIVSGAFPYTVSTLSKIHTALDLETNVAQGLRLVRASAGQSQFLMRTGGNNAWESPVWNCERSRGTVASPAVVNDGDDVLSLNAAVWTTGSTYAACANVTLEAAGTSSSSSSPGRITFATTPSGSTSPVERLRIDASGNVVIGTAALATNATNGFFYVSTCAGTPTGTPTSYTGRAPLVWNSSANTLHIYSGGSWRTV